ncbi:MULTISPECIES: type VI secretion system lipoprotein TssJ [unclassified Gilliamella]|nr:MULTISPECIES: type VI secretion system lipoprotein TssJ [unclassified Gilliamella]MWP73784.1 type VI secretion system lipoprotein TssJ [Gilliamella sp. Pra-s52]
MKIINLFIAILLTIWLTGCGIAQSVTEEVSDLSNSLFTWDIRTLHLDITARAELNMDDEGRSSPVVIRIYQLKEADIFNSISYQELVDQDSDILRESLVDSKEIVLKPNTAISIDTSFNKKAKAVGIAALYKEPNLKDNSWRLILNRGDLNISKPREISASQYTIKLVDESR